MTVARFARIVALFALLAVVMTWPQALRLANSAEDHQDVYFNMWRFGWAAHALTTAPSRFFDGNIFYPERRTLTLSDAMPIESVLAAPMLWAGLPPVLVHNVMLLGGIVLSAAGIFVLAQSLTGSTGAAIAAGIIFGFAPYRFDHYMHMELQWTVWVPWAFWAALRAIDTGRVRYGVAAGVFVALQFLCSIYYGVFLATLLGLTGLLLLAGLRGQQFSKGLAALAMGGVLSIALAAPYGSVYFATRDRVGERSPNEIAMFSAHGHSYTAATPGNFLYGERTARAGRPELRLFPGILPVLLAVVGLLLVPPKAEPLAFVVALVVAFEMSLGLRGYSYAFLYDHVPIFTALRAPARLGVFVLFFVALLAAYGHTALEQALPRAGRRVLAAAICGVLMLEYWVAPLTLVPYPNTPPPLYTWLSRQAPGVVAEFPMPTIHTLPGNEPQFEYASTFHWMPLLNGYSGYYPPAYLHTLDRLKPFPDPSAVAVLGRSGVRYIIVHTTLYRDREEEIVDVLEELSRNPSLAELGRFKDLEGDAVVYRLR